MPETLNQAHNGRRGVRAICHRVGDTRVVTGGVGTLTSPKPVKSTPCVTEVFPVVVHSNPGTRAARRPQRNQTS